MKRRVTVSSITILVAFCCSCGNFSDVLGVNADQLPVSQASINYPPESANGGMDGANANYGMQGGMDGPIDPNLMEGQEGAGVAVDKDKIQEIVGDDYSESEEQIEKEEVVAIIVTSEALICIDKDERYSAISISNTEEESIFSRVDVFAQYENLRCIKFHEVQLTSKDLVNIRDFIGLAKALEVLVFESCVIIDREDTHYIAEMIEKLNSLISIVITYPKTLKLGNKKGEIHLPAKYVQQITEAISKKRDLEQIVAAFTSINDVSCEHITKTVQQSPKLTSLLLGWTEMFGDKATPVYKELSEAIGKAEKLKTLTMSMLNVSEEGIGSLFENISHLSKLDRLVLFIGNLKDCSNSFDLASKLAGSLENLRELTELQLQNMELPANAMQVIIQSLESLKKLESLNISCNSISGETVDKLAAILPELTDLQMFVARGCDITSLGNLGQAFGASTLKILCLGNNQIGHDVLTIQVPPTLKFLDVTGNSIDREDLLTLLEGLLQQEDTDMQAVDCRNNDSITEDDRDLIEQWQAQNGSKAAILLKNAFGARPLKKTEATKKAETTVAR